MAPSTDPIVQRMRAIRSSRDERIERLEREGRRVVDWREHVKAAPMASMALSLSMGFLMARRAATQSKLHSENDDIQRMARQQRTPWFADLIVPLATVVLKRLALQWVQNWDMTTHHDRSRQK